MKTVYFDTCSLQRPFDDRSQIRIALEADAILTLLDLAEAGVFAIISSDPLLYEIRRNPDALRRSRAMTILAEADQYVVAEEAVYSRAGELNRQGLKPMDALHLAAAEQGSADYFCTCDDRFYKKALSLAHPPMRVIMPLELLQELVQ